MRLPIVLASTALLLAGCGSSGPHTYTTASDLAHDLNCSTYTHTLPPYTDQGMSDLGSCSFDNHHFVVKVYHSDADMQAALSILSGPYLHARNWVVLCSTDVVDCQAEQDNIGGTLSH